MRYEIDPLDFFTWRIKFDCGSANDIKLLELSVTEVECLIIWGDYNVTVCYDGQVFYAVALRGMVEEWINVNFICFS